MTDSMTLFKLGHGSPLVCAADKRVAAAPFPSNLTLVAALAGKRIVPVWLYFSIENAAADDLKITLKGVTSSNIILNAVCVRGSYGQSYVFNLKGEEFNTLNIGEAIRVTVADHSNCNLALSLGYYLING